MWWSMARETLPTRALTCVWILPYTTIKRTCPDKCLIWRSHLLLLYSDHLYTSNVMGPYWNYQKNCSQRKWALNRLLALCWIKTFFPLQVVDMGCAECKLLKSLKFHRHIESLIGVDIDSSLLESHHHSLQPLVTDYLQRRPRPLKIQLFKG